MDKTHIRELALRRRQVMLPGDMLMRTNEISTKLMELINWNKIHRLHIYTSQPGLNEVDTMGIYQVISERFPLVAITKGNPSKHALIPTQLYDLIIVPLIAFDQTGHRIGFGGGWYDRFLSTQPNAQKIGLAYELQLVGTIPAEPHDEPLDAVITEVNIYTSNKNALPK